MGEQNVIRLRGVTIYHTDDPFGSRSEKKLLQQGELILSDLNFDINAGEFVYLIGRVGSGKSSLLKTLYAELQLIEGEGYVCSSDLYDRCGTAVHASGARFLLPVRRQEVPLAQHLPGGSWTLLLIRNIWSVGRPNQK